jgi:23S rRNA (adenine2503-C2)-methyltransferase
LIAGTQDPLPLMGLTLDELAAALHQRYGKGYFHASALFRALYATLDPDPLGSAQIVPALAEKIRGDFRLLPGSVVTEEVQPGVVKFVTRLADGLEVESVVLSMRTHQTVCVSSQVGCRMACRFCETAKMGLQRNLTAAEIVGQVWTARRRYGPGVRNVVFMGMGEPLDNTENVLKAIRILSDQRGLDVAPRYITVSTAGHLEGIYRLARENIPRLRLALSLNAPDDNLRSELMPINRQSGIKRLREALLAFPGSETAAFMLGYVQLPGVNDLARHAAALARFLRGLSARINLIPFNPGSDSPFRAPTEAEIARFYGDLSAHGIFVCRRRTKGRDLMAACGQLGKPIFRL